MLLRHWTHNQKKIEFDPITLTAGIANFLILANLKTS